MIKYMDCPEHRILLRRRAEEMVRKNAAAAQEKLETLSIAEVRQMLHELRVHQVELELQNDELRRTQQELDTTRARYFDLYDLAPAGYVTVSESGLILEANLTAANLWGVARSLVIRQPFSRFIAGEDQDVWYLRSRELLKSEGTMKCELRMKRLDDSTFWAQLEAVEAEDEQGIRYSRVIVSDISARKNTEEELRKADQENRELLRELGHRAKNSLNLINSMINLSASVGTSFDLKTILGELGSRVRSVAELYSILQANGSYTEVRLDEYCARIANPLVGLSGNIELQMDMEAIVIPAKKATSLGLIVTELIMNAQNHAFPDDGKGTITIALHRTAGGCRLEVSDDGAGLPPDFDLHTSAGTGLGLVRGLVDQIRSRFSVEPLAKGTRCAIDITLEDANR